MISNALTQKIKSNWLNLNENGFLSPSKAKQELLIVLGLTFGSSGLNAIIDLLQNLLSKQGIHGSSVTLVPQISAQTLITILSYSVILFKTFSIAGIGWYLLNQTNPGWFIKIRALDFKLGVGLAALIGIPGLLLVWVSRILDLNVQIVPVTTTHWWIYPISTLMALGNGFSEEILVVAFCLSRLRYLNFSYINAILLISLLRASYHLYQGFGAGVGNFVMGLIFGVFYLYSRKIFPLIFAHFLLDFFAFSGFSLLLLVAPSFAYNLIG